MRRALSVSLSLTLLLFAGGFASAQQVVNTQLAVPNSPAYERAAEYLRNEPSRNYSFSGAHLADVMRLMAEEAGISFFGLPDAATGADRMVTFSINASPFTALETLAKANGISLIVENEIWYLRPADDRELVGRIYHINYNAQEMVKKNDQVGALGGSAIGPGGGGAGSIGLNLQGAPDFFVREPSRLLEDIEAILDLRTTGRNALLAPDGSVDTLGQVAIGGLQGQPDLVVRQDSSGEGTDSAVDSDQAKVIWNSDSNSLYVVATRQQHQWVEGYLAAADRPQPLVAVEVKIIEINKDPQRELGIDWTGTLSGGWGATVTGVNDTISGPIDLNNLGDYRLPTAILSYDEVNLRLRALFDDRKNRAVSYPRMITMDNREVSFRSVINQPVLSSNASTSLGAGATETNSVEYVPIGTVINILPKRMGDDKVLLNVSLTVSDIVGTEIINGNPFPIATSRVYTAPITVESGYTVAISGLDAAEDDRAVQGVPFLGRIPVLGYAFKFRGDASSRQHLMMLITPTLLNPTDPGVPERPTIRNPWGDKLPSFEPFDDDKDPIEEKRMYRFHKDKDKYYKDTAPPPHVPHYGPHHPAEEPAPYPPHQVAEVEGSGGAADGLPTGQERNLENTGGANAPMIVEGAVAEPEGRPKRRGSLLAGLFKKRDRPQEIPSGPTEGEERMPAWEDPLPAQPVTYSATEEEAMQDDDPRGFLADRRTPPEEEVPPAQAPQAPEPRPIEIVEVPERSALQPDFPVEMEKEVGIRWDGTELVGGSDSVITAVSQLEKRYQAAEDGEQVDIDSLTAETNRLLEYVNSLRDEARIPTDGELSDEWWDLIRLKTQFNALARDQATAVADLAPSEL